MRLADAASPSASSDVSTVCGVLRRLASLLSFVTADVSQNKFS